MKNAKVRITKERADILLEHLCSRYPYEEAATFFECGWSEGSESLIVTVNDLMLPKAGDMDSKMSGVGLNEQYSLRCALEFEQKKWAIGLVHSHPEGSATYPSSIDDDMDQYYSEYFSGFTKDRPYVSLILSKDKRGKIRFSGRVFYKGQWLLCAHLQIVGDDGFIVRADNVKLKPLPLDLEKRLERLTGVLGKRSAEKLWRSNIVIVGAGGTGSALFHSFVRSCVGRIVIIDPDFGSESNTERVHGFYEEDLRGEPVRKVDMLKRLAAKINPNIEVVALPIDVRDPLALKYLIEADIVFGCTDSQVGKVLISDHSIRHLIPSFHVNVAMEGNEDQLVSEIIHLIKYGPQQACVYCRELVDAQKLSQELMSPEEKLQRQLAEQNQNATHGAYWIGDPVIHTMGSLTTAASELVANYAIGQITGLYKMPEDFLEIDLLKIQNGAVCVPMKRRAHCMCKERDGVASQGEPWL